MSGSALNSQSVKKLATTLRADGSTLKTRLKKLWSAQDKATIAQALSALNDLELELEAAESDLDQISSAARAAQAAEVKAAAEEKKAAAAEKKEDEAKQKKIKEIEKLTIQQLLAGDDYTKEFSAYVKSVYETENWNFLVDVREKNKNVQELVEEYIVDGARQQVNLSAKLRDAVIEAAKVRGANLNIFRDAYAEISALMTTNALMRFKKKLLEELKES